MVAHKAVSCTVYDEQVKTVLIKTVRVMEYICAGVCNRPVARAAALVLYVTSPSGSCSHTGTESMHDLSGSERK